MDFATHQQMRARFRLSQVVDSFPDPEAKLNDIIGKIPLGKRMTPPRIAAMVIFLVSAQAGTGQRIFVDDRYTHLDLCSSLTCRMLLQDPRDPLGDDLALTLLEHERIHY